MSSGPIRVLVVDDSLTVRQRIVEALAPDPRFEVVGEATDGKEAVERCRALRPDVITLDMIMPEMSGLAATEVIMAYVPTPILIVSASFQRREILETFDALAAGAVDALDKPGAGQDDEAWDRQLRATLARVARIRVIRHPRARLRPPGPSPVDGLLAAELAGLEPLRGCRTIAVGASTGGPAALLAVLGALPRSFAVPVVVVLHVHDRFDFAFADWLDTQLSLPVREAREDDALECDRPLVLVAPPGRHVEIRGGRVRLTEGPERNYCRPSVDVLFESLAREPAAGEVVGVLLTGMGRDGAEGLLALRRAGAVTIAQDEATSVIWGMPGAAAALGAVEHVLPLEGVAPALIRLAGCP